MCMAFERFSIEQLISALLLLYALQVEDCRVSTPHDQSSSPTFACIFYLQSCNSVQIIEANLNDVTSNTKTASKLATFERLSVELFAQTLSCF